LSLHRDSVGRRGLILIIRLAAVAGVEEYDRSTVQNLLNPIGGEAFLTVQQQKALIGFRQVEAGMSSIVDEIVSPIAQVSRERTYSAGAVGVRGWW